MNISNIKTNWKYSSSKPPVSCVLVSRGKRITYLNVTIPNLAKQNYENIQEWVIINGSQTAEEAAEFDTYVSDKVKPF